MTRTRWQFGLAGVGLLAVAIGGTHWCLSRGLARGAATTSPPPAEVVVCFGHVDVPGGVVALAPVVPGRIVSIDAKEDEAVDAGAVLLRLDDAAARLRAEEARAAVTAGERQFDEVARQPARHRAQVAQQESAVEAVGYRLAAARHQAERKRDLYKRDQANAHELAAAEDLVRELESVERAEQEKLRESKLLDPESGVRRAEAELNAARARLAQAERAVEDCVLRAPRAGKVLRLQAAVGDLAGVAGPPPIVFCPDGPRIVRAEVAQEFAAAVRVGAECSIADDCRGSGPTWRGTVARVSDWYTRRRSVVLEPTQHNDVRTLECVIELAPGEPLRIGQQVRVTIGQ
jgi:multidrug resistance efflux pump